MLDFNVPAEQGGDFADTGGNVVVPPGTPLKTGLCHVTRTALDHALRCARGGAVPLAD